MVIFHSYVKLPEGISSGNKHGNRKSSIQCDDFFIEIGDFPLPLRYKKLANQWQLAVFETWIRKVNIHNPNIFG
jgi:hypothetical protein